MNKIIVQDTDKSILEVLAIVLEEEGFNVLTTTVYDKIIAQIDEFRPHVVLLDFKLNGADSIEACKLIKSKYDHLPVVALSCNTNINTIYATNGFDGYIEKPFDLENLYTILRKYIKDANEFS